MSHAASETRFSILLFTDLVGSTDLKVRQGVPAYRDALLVHNRHFERIAGECHGLRILQNMGDGYFAEAGSVVEAVRFALLFQDAMRVGPWGEIRLSTRIGIHAGEVAAMAAEGGTGILAPAADLAARVMSLAIGGQILLTRFPFDEARHFLREHPAVPGRETPLLCWLAHGPYLFKGRDEPLEIFEVGAEGLAPLMPPEGEKARRAIRPGEEETLGWRPAIGLEIPGRPGWRLTGKLGAGGFGEVWIGEHAKLRQRRAFKFCFDDERLRALKREVTLVRLLRTALGDREDIVRLHEIKLDEPPFYLESDLAPHGNLLQWAEKQGGLATIALAQRIELVAHTATALAAAHSIGVLHKDIKPTNILIFDAPDGGVRPRLVDFGIGTLADPAVLVQHGITAAGFTPATIKHSTGTPTYSPPEYLAGKPYTIQGDIYGLGVLLYQLVTAKPLDPLAVGWERDITDPLLREDIAACVDGDPGRRLPSAADLADRLSHLKQRRAKIAEQERLTREAAARAESEAAAIAARIRAKRLGKLAAGFAVLALLAISGGVFALVNQRRATAARAKVVEQKAELAQKKSEVDRKNAEYRAMLVESARSDRLSAEENLRLGRQPAAFCYLARACDYDPPSTLAAEKAIAELSVWHYPLPTVILAGKEHFLWSARFSPDGTRIVTAALDKTVRVWDAATGKALATLAGHEEVVRSAQFSPDGTRIVTTSDDKTARVWDAATGKALTTLAGHEEGVSSAQFSPDGTRIVTASLDKTARVWDAATGKALATLAEHEEGVSSARFSPDGTRIVTASDDKTARVWDATTGNALVTLAGHEHFVWTAHFSPDGTRIVTASLDKTARVWDAATGKALATLAGHEGEVLSAQFNSDGTRIVTTSSDKTARVWDAATGKALATLAGHEEGVWSAQFSPDGTRIVTASLDKTARLWGATTGKALATLAGHEGGVLSAQFNSDGTRIVTTSSDRTARVWDASTGKALATLAGHDGVVSSAQFSPDGTRIVTMSLDKTARVWDAATGKALATLAGHEEVVRSAQFSPDGTRIVTTSADNTARVWDAATGKSLATLAGHDGVVLGAQFSPDGSRIVTASLDKTARLWDAATGKALATLAGHEEGVSSAQFSPDGTHIVTASADNTARVWDAATGKSLATLAGHDGVVLGAQFSPDGSRIVIIAKSKTARVWDAATGKSLATLAGHEGVVLSAQFSPDGSRIVTASEDKTARVWNAATGIALATLAGHEGVVLSAQFSPDGSRIVTASADNTARVWDAATGKALATLAGHEGRVWSAQFNPDGTRIVTASSDKTARLWTVLPPSAGSPPEWFPDFLRYIAQMRLNSDGELETLKAADWLAFRERLRGVLRGSVGQDTPYLIVLRKYVRE